MKNENHWKPSKFEMVRGKLRASRNTKYVGLGSRLIVDLIATLYQEHLPKNCSGRLLDLGCGHVPLYMMYRSLVDDCTCVDWASSLHENEFLDVVHDLTQPLPFEDATFDTIICSDVLEHIPTPMACVAEISRVLKPGGKVIFNVPFLYWIHEAPYDFHRYTEFAIQRMFDSNGLEIDILHPAGGSFVVVGDILSKTFAKLRTVGRPLSLLAQGMANLLRRYQTDHNQRQFPLLYFVVATKPEGHATK